MRKDPMSKPRQIFITQSKVLSWAKLNIFLNFWIHLRQPRELERSSICERLGEQSGSTITVQSTLGRTAFLSFWPLTVESHAPVHGTLAAFLPKQGLIYRMRIFAPDTILFEPSEQGTAKSLASILHIASSLLPEVLQQADGKSHHPFSLFLILADVDSRKEAIENQKLQYLAALWPSLRNTTCTRSLVRCRVQMPSRAWWLCLFQVYPCHPSRPITCLRLA